MLVLPSHPKYSVVSINPYPISISWQLASNSRLELMAKLACQTCQLFPVASFFSLIKAHVMSRDYCDCRKRTAKANCKSELQKWTAIAKVNCRSELQKWTAIAKVNCRSVAKLNCSRAVELRNVRWPWALLEVHLSYSIVHLP